MVGKGDLKALREELLMRYPKSRLTPMSENEIEKMWGKYPGVPTDFLEYLRVVGRGSIGEIGFMVYQGPSLASDIYSEPDAEELNGIVFVGDDFSGYVVGYDMNRGWKLGEVGTSAQFEPIMKRSVLDATQDSSKVTYVESFVEMIMDRFIEPFRGKT